MGFFEEFTTEVKDILQTGEKKVGDIITGSKIQMDINSINNRIDEVYCRIGRSVWEQRDNPIFQCYAEEFERLEQLNKALNLQSENLANTKGHKRCAACGAFAPADAKFCNKCGKNI